MYSIALHSAFPYGIELIRIATGEGMISISDDYERNHDNIWELIDRWLRAMFNLIFLVSLCL